MSWSKYRHRNDQKNIVITDSNIIQSILSFVFFKKGVWNIWKQLSSCSEDLLNEDPTVYESDLWHQYDKNSLTYPPW